MGEPTKIPNSAGKFTDEFRSLRGRTDQDSQRSRGFLVGCAKSTWENRPRFPTLRQLLRPPQEVYVGEPTKIPNPELRRVEGIRSLRGRTDQDSQRQPDDRLTVGKSTWENRPRFPTSGTVSTIAPEVYVGEPTKIPNCSDVLSSYSGSLRGRTDQDSQLAQTRANHAEKSTWENRPRFPTLLDRFPVAPEVYVGEPTKIPNRAERTGFGQGSLRGRTDQDSQQDLLRLSGDQKSTWENRPRFPTCPGSHMSHTEVYVGEPTKIPNTPTTSPHGTGSLRGRTDQDSQPVQVLRRMVRKSTWENRPRFPTPRRERLTTREVYVGEPTKIPNANAAQNLGL